MQPMLRLSARISQAGPPAPPTKHITSMASNSNPCLSCGACCAHYRVSFYWAEAGPDGPVPEDLTTQITPSRVAMRGTDRSAPRCIALEGEIGAAVVCRIYAHRPSVCREFKAFWEAGAGGGKCDAARARHGLPIGRIPPHGAEPSRVDQPDVIAAHPVSLGHLSPAPDQGQLAPDTLRGSNDADAASGRVAGQDGEELCHTPPI